MVRRWTPRKPPDAFGSIARAAAATTTGEANAAGGAVVRFVPTETSIISAAAKQMARVWSAAKQAQERLDRAKTLADPTKDDFATSASPRIP